MPRLELLDMPLEVVTNIFQWLPGKDQKNLALTCSAVLNIVAPTLYRTARLFYAEPGKDVKFDGLPRLADISHLISSPQFPLGYTKSLSIKRKRGHDSSAPNPKRRQWVYGRDKKEQMEFTETADKAIGLILNRFNEGQLESIRLDHQTTYNTFKLICERQKKIRSLDLGEFRPGGNRCKIPNQILIPGSLALESLEICEIDERVTCLVTFIKILHQNSPTLKRLRIGDQTHPQKPRLTASAWARRPRSKTNLPFSRIDFPALEQISIIHDHSAERFWDMFQDIAYCGSKLSHVRISCFTDPYVLIQRLVSKGADGIKSIQTNNCRRRNHAAFQSPVHNQLPRIKSLETLQMQVCTHEEGEFQAAYLGRTTIKRLWLQCSANCDPKKCRSMAGLLDYATNTSLSSDKWPVLEELAIGAPQWKKSESDLAGGWLELPMLRSLKILRLLQWQTGTQQQKNQQTVELLLPRVENYVNLIYCWSMVAYGKLPNLRIIVVDTETGQGCPGTAIFRPLYFVVYPIDEFVDADGTGLTVSPLVFSENYETALKVCKEINCSSYLLQFGPPAPEGFWDDQYSPDL
ncbi:hypothetical protein TWF481_006582 [Arthrobotrys musiformis]|uniref:F-box domain-containing protein n=1 Tax=Arthrobotrys musiformis TaxID=47236 RepID=A0AAV9WAY6_9PEZI